jgi:hypothetical protein
MTKPKAGTKVAFNAGGGILTGVVTKDGILVTLVDTIRVRPQAGLVSAGPGKALAPAAREGTGVGQYQEA